MSKFCVRTSSWVYIYTNALCKEVEVNQNGEDSVADRSENPQYYIILMWENEKCNNRVPLYQYSIAKWKEVTLFFINRHYVY